MVATPEQMQQLEAARLAFANAQKVGSADLDDLREAYQTLAADLSIDLSGKVDPGPDQQPDEAYVKPGGWNANPDAKTWKVSPMKNPPSDFKVVDDKGVNVATNFHTVITANTYITKHQATPTPACLPGFHKDTLGVCVPDVVGPSGDKDQFGIIMIKKSAASGKVETGFKLEEKERNYASGKPSEWSTEYTNVSPTPIENVEVTIYEKINGFKTSEPDTISLKLGGPAHHDGACCWLIPDFMTDGSAKKTMETEWPHPNNHPVNPKPLTSIGASIVGKWLGYKGISQQNKSGGRHVESWIHFPVENIDDVKAEQDKWVKYIDVDIPDTRFFKASGNLTTSRLDGTTKGSPPEYKFASVREIVQA